MSIHPTACVSKKAKLDKSVKVGAFTFIGDNVSIGADTEVGTHCFVDGHTIIGKHCQVFTGAVVGSRPQDLKFKGETSYLEIGDHNVIREYCTINPGTGEGGRTVIGDHNLFMAYAHIAHDCVIGSHCIMVNNGTLGGHVVMEDHSMLSGLSAVHQFVRLGKYSFVGGCSKVVQDVPPYSTCDGHPARIFGLNLVGLRRKDFSRDTLKALDRAYNVLFHSGKPMNKALAEISKEKKLIEEVEYLIEFVKNSSRGIARSCRVDRVNGNGIE